MPDIIEMGRSMDICQGTWFKGMEEGNLSPFSSSFINR